MIYFKTIETTATAAGLLRPGLPYSFNPQDPRDWALVQSLRQVPEVVEITSQEARDLLATGSALLADGDRLPAKDIPDDVAQDAAADVAQDSTVQKPAAKAGKGDAAVKGGSAE